MSSINFSLSSLPVELHQHISKKLNLRDITTCFFVSKEWGRIFSQELVWEHLAPKDKIKKVNYFSIHNFVTNNKNIFDQLPILIQNYLIDTQNFYQSYFVQKNLLNEFKNEKDLKDIKENYPKKWISYFGSAENIQSLPCIEFKPEDLPLNNDGVKYFENEYFFQPIVRALTKSNWVLAGWTYFGKYKYHILLFRIKNNKTGEIHCEAINLLPKYIISSTKSGKSHFSSTDASSCDIEIDRLKRLIQRKPVGLCEKDEIEGPTTLPNGKSVLELC